MGDGGLERTLDSGTFGIDVNPLVVESGVGKLADALLGELNIVGYADILAEESGKFIVVIDDNFTHILGFYWLFVFWGRG